MGVGSLEWEVFSVQYSVVGVQGKGISGQSQFSVSVSVSVFSIIHLICESVAKKSTYSLSLRGTRSLIKIM